MENVHVHFQLEVNLILGFIRPPLVSFLPMYKLSQAYYSFIESKEMTGITTRTKCCMLYHKTVNSKLLTCPKYLITLCFGMPYGIKRTKAIKTSGHGLGFHHHSHKIRTTIVEVGFNDMTYYHKPENGQPT